MSSSKVVAALICSFAVFPAISGCQPKAISDNLVTNPSIEEALDQSGMPRGWSFSVDSGNYKHDRVESCQSGKYALVVAGAGGQQKFKQTRRLFTKGWFSNVKPGCKRNS